jgi:hypothetical protein
MKTQEEITKAGDAVSDMLVGFTPENKEDFFTYLLAKPAQKDLRVYRRQQVEDAQKGRNRPSGFPAFERRPPAAPPVDETTT